VAHTVYNNVRFTAAVSTPEIANASAAKLSMNNSGSLTITAYGYLVDVIIIQF
jgi:hypothetical protein